jgi:hypothetical protein
MLFSVELDRPWGQRAGKGKGKAIPLQPWTGPEGCRSLRFPELDNRHMKVVRLLAIFTGRLYPPGNIPGTHFC